MGHRHLAFTNLTGDYIVVTQTVEVAAQSPVRQTDSATLSTVVAAQSVQDLRRFRSPRSTTSSPELSVITPWIIPQAYIMQWNLTVQKQFGANVVSAGYVGQVARHLGSFSSL